MEVFSARLLHILVITIIKTMVMFNKSPKGSKDKGSNWLRKEKFRFSLQVPVASGMVWKMMLQAFYPVRGCLKISESLYATHGTRQRSGFS